MDYVSVKDDLRDRISAFYGVSKVFMLITLSGGLNNEGMQILLQIEPFKKHKLSIIIMFSHSLQNNLVLQIGI